jgi:DNA-binding IscR family transcriptional regulator
MSTRLAGTRKKLAGMALADLVECRAGPGNGYRLTKIVVARSR